MQIAQLKICTDCGTLKAMYSLVNCSIYQLIKNKWNSVAYNNDAYFDENQYSTLLRLKRILYKRLYNQQYPNTTVFNQDIISISTRYLYKQTLCPDCPCEDFSDFFPTTSTTTLLPVSNCYNYAITATDPGSAESVINYTGCDGYGYNFIMASGETTVVCVKNDEITATNALIIKGGLC